MDTPVLVSQLVGAALPILISLVAVGVAIVRYRVHPTVSILAIGAFVLHLGGITLAIVSQAWIIGAARNGTDIEAPAVMFGVLQIAISVAFLVLISAAVFVGRGKGRRGTVTNPHATGHPTPGDEVGAPIS